MFGYFKMMIAVVMIAGIAGAGMYVMKLQRDNAILKINQIKLEESVSTQKVLIDKQKEDFEEKYLKLKDQNKKLSPKEIIKRLKNTVAGRDGKINEYLTFWL